MVSWRRSAPNCGAPEIGFAGGSLSEIPQVPQNLALGGLRLRQDGQKQDTGAPQAVQKRPPSITSAWQIWHSIPHPNGPTAVNLSCMSPLTTRSILTRPSKGGAYDSIQRCTVPGQERAGSRVSRRPQGCGRGL